MLISIAIIFLLLFICSLVFFYWKLNKNEKEILQNNIESAIKVKKDEEKHSSDPIDAVRRELYKDSRD